MPTGHRLTGRNPKQGVSENHLWSNHVANAGAFHFPRSSGNGGFPVPGDRVLGGSHPLPLHGVTKCWADIGRHLTRPEAIVCISAHFEATFPLITGGAHPETIHDFGGPPELFALAYPCPGEPMLAEQIHHLLSKAQMTPRINRSRGLDHGAWVPLLHM